MDTQAQLLAEIEAYIAERKIAASTFGRLAVNDGKFVSRLRAGANMTLGTVERVRSFLRAAAPVASVESPSLEGEALVSPSPFTHGQAA